MIFLLLVSIVGALAIHGLNLAMAQQKSKENKRRILMIKRVVVLYTILFASLVALSVTIHAINLYFPPPPSDTQSLNTAAPATSIAGAFLNYKVQKHLIHRNNLRR